MNPAADEFRKVINGVSTTTIRVQPVEPESEGPAAAVGEIVAATASLFLGALSLMLALGAAHSVWPQVPAVGYWTATGLLLGLQTLKTTFRRPPWKWARR